MSQWYVVTSPGPSLRLAHADQESGVHGNHSDCPGARDWRQHSHLQCGQRRAPSAARLSRPRPPDAAQRDVARLRFDGRRLSKLPGLEGAEPALRRLAAFRWNDYDVTGKGQPEHLSGKMV